MARASWSTAFCILVLVWRKWPEKSRWRAPHVTSVNLRTAPRVLSNRPRGNITASARHDRKGLQADDISTSDSYKRPIDCDADVSKQKVPGVRRRQQPRRQVPRRHEQAAVPDVWPAVPRHHRRGVFCADPGDGDSIREARPPRAPAEQRRGAQRAPCAAQGGHAGGILRT